MHYDELIIAITLFCAIAIPASEALRLHELWYVTLALSIGIGIGAFISTIALLSLQTTLELPDWYGTMMSALAWVVILSLIVLTIAGYYLRYRASLQDTASMDFIEQNHEDDGTKR